MVAAYRDGVPGASDRLWRTSLRLVPRILATRVHPEMTLRQALAGIEREDLDGHIALEILEAAQRFDPERASWATYVSHRLHGRLRDLARKLRRWETAAAVTWSLDALTSALDEEDDVDGATWHDVIAAPGPSPETIASRTEALSHYLLCEKSKRA